MRNNDGNNKKPAAPKLKMEFWKHGGVPFAACRPWLWLPHMRVVVVAIVVVIVPTRTLAGSTLRNNVKGARGALRRAFCSSDAVAKTGRRPSCFVTRTTTTTTTTAASQSCCEVAASKMQPRLVSFPHTFQRQMSSTHHDNVEETEAKKTVVIVGGGWAGYAAADALTHVKGEKMRIVLLNAESSPGGLAGAGGSASQSTGEGGGGGGRAREQPPLEAGIHGFWRHYVNTLQVIQQSIGFSDLDQVLTPYTPSILISEKGRVAVAPVLGSEDKDDGTSQTATETLRNTLLDASGGRIQNVLPPPLDLALLSEFDEMAQSRRLSTVDRLTGLGLLGPWIDFLADRGAEDNDDEEAWCRYDSLTASDLFDKVAGLSPALYQELVLPLLAVLPMGTGQDISAAAALSCFHVFCLQSKGCFDVRWCRGNLARRLFVPWTRRLQTEKGVDFRFQTRVTQIQRSLHKQEGGDERKPLEIVLQNKNREEERLHCDAVIFAVGGVAMGRIQQASPKLFSSSSSSVTEEACREFSRLQGITCVSVRLFLTSTVVTSNLKGGMYSQTQAPPALAQAMTDSPVLVCGPNIVLPELQDVGFCVYDLQRLHDDFAVVNCPAAESGGGVLEVDFFRAQDIADMTSDEGVADLALRAIAAATQSPRIPQSSVREVGVVRSRRAVSHFFPGASVAFSPRGVRLLADGGLYACGDWVDRTSGHSSWSTEKSVVTGRQAARALVEDLWGTEAANQLPSILPPPGAAGTGGGVPDPQQVLRSLRKLGVQQQRERRGFGRATSITPSPWALAKATLNAIGLSLGREEK